MNDNATNRLLLSAWVLFALSGVFFLIDAARTGEWTAWGSAITWLVGVGLFLVAHVRDG